MSRRSARNAPASSSVTVAARRTRPRRRSARSGAGCSGRSSSCRSPIRRPGPASRPRRMSKLTPSTAWTLSACARASRRRDGEVLGQVACTRRSGSPACAVMPAILRGCSSTQATLWPCADVAQRRAGVAAARHRVAGSARRNGSRRQVAAGSARRPGWPRRGASSPRGRCAGSSGTGPACRDGADGRTASTSAPPRPPGRRTSRPRARHVSATTPRSWVISSTAMPIALQRCSSSRICAWIVTSSAVVGSSAISSSGLHDSAMAIMTRWRMPPENWCG